MLAIIDRPVYLFQACTFPPHGSRRASASPPSSSGTASPSTRSRSTSGPGNGPHSATRNSGTDWAHRFDDHAQEVLTERPEDALSLIEHPDARLAVPSADHFLPLLHTAGMAAGSGESLDSFSKGYAWGSVSMTSYRSAA